MASGVSQTAPSWFGTLRATVLGRPTKRRWGPILVQLLLIAAWHRPWAFAVPPPLKAIIGPASHFWHELGFTSYCIEDMVTLESPLMIFYATLQVSWLELVALLGAAAFLVYRRLVKPAEATLPGFVRSWWRSCLWGLLVLPTGAVVFGVLPVFVFKHGILIALLAYLVLGPGLIARTELRRYRRSRWSPVCPECGYSLRRLSSDRCPECGTAFPTVARTFRRWATRRLRWDRAERGILPTAYVKTALTVMFRPCRAARGLATPDRFPRAVRWALAHLLVTAILLAAVGSGGRILRWLVMGWWFGPPQWYGVYSSMSPPLGAAIGWLAQALLAWFVPLAVLPGLGLFLAAALPGHHPATRRGIAKWSLYSASIVILPYIVGYAAQCVVWLRHAALSPAVTWPQAWQSLSELRSPPYLLAVVAYGTWWAAGVSVNPYLRRRGFRVFVTHLAVLIVAALLLTRYLFPAGVLENLL